MPLLLRLNILLRHPNIKSRLGNSENVMY